MSGMINTNTKNNERGLFPYPIILAASKGTAEFLGGDKLRKSPIGSTDIQ